jgi:hypothetical protein
MDLPKDYFKQPNLVQQSLNQLAEKNHSDPAVFSEISVGLNKS